MVSATMVLLVSRVPDSIRWRDLGRKGKLGVVDFGIVEIGWVVAMTCVCRVWRSRMPIIMMVPGRKERRCDASNK